MKRSTLTLTASVFALLAGGMLVPETALAYKPKKEWKHVVMYDPNDLGHVMSRNYIRRKGDRVRGTSVNFGGEAIFGEMATAFGAICNVGGLVATGMQIVGAAATGPVGWGVGGVCLASQIFGLGAPPPKPTVVTFRSPDIRQTINVDGPPLENDSARYFMYAPIQADEEKSIPKLSDEVPMSEVSPPAPKSVVPPKAASTAKPRVPVPVPPKPDEQEAQVESGISNYAAGLAKF
ncbi:MAG: hypothetical protein WAZ27_04070 [Minisyncoccia bacterium]